MPRLRVSSLTGSSMTSSGSSFSLWLTRTFADQVEALKNYRSKGEQKNMLLDMRRALRCHPISRRRLTLRHLRPYMAARKKILCGWTAA